MNQEHRKIWRLIVYAACLVLAMIPFGVLSRMFSGRPWGQLAWSSAMQLAILAALATVFSAAWLFVRPRQIIFRLLRNFFLLGGEILAIFLSARLYRIVAGLELQDIDWRLMTLVLLVGGIASAIALTVIEGSRAR